MFRWQKELKRLDIPASQVFHLERSLSAAQVALPGLPSQDATAYLCVFSVGKGLRAALALHLHTSHCLAFYLPEREDVPQRVAGRLIEEGISFAESLGFMLSDADFRKLGAQQRIVLWDSLPLKNGVEPPVVSPSSSYFPLIEPVEEVLPPEVAPAAADTVRQEDRPFPAAQPSAKLVVAAVEEVLTPAPGPGKDVAAPAASHLSEPPSHDSVQRRAPAVRPRVPKQSLRPEELTVRRQKLLESLGRFLASL